MLFLKVNFKHIFNCINYIESVLLIKEKLFDYKINLFCSNDFLKFLILSKLLEIPFTKYRKNKITLVQ